MPERKYDSLIFDLDGTLWDASAVSARAWLGVARGLGLDLRLGADEVRAVSGLPFDQCVEKVFGPSADGIADLKSRLDEAERAEFEAAGGWLYEGVSEGLHALAREYPLFLVSNCQDWYLEAFFKHSGLRGIFRDSLCFGQTGRPKSENIKEIARRHRLRAAAYVGDTHWDQQASAEAGADFIFVTFGFGSSAAPALSVDSVGDLVRALADPAYSLAAGSPSSSRSRRDRSS